MLLKFIDFFKTSWYWFFTGLLLLLFFVSQGHSFSQVFYFITFLLPVVIGTAYYVNNRLIPDFLLRKKHALFVLYSIYTIIISLYLQYLIIFLALYLFATLQMENKTILTLDISNLSLVLYILVLIRILMVIIQKLNQKEIIINELERKERIEAELLPKKIIVRYKRMNHPISISCILYIESLADYIKIVTKEDEIVTKEKISKIKERLPDHFQRTHRSFIVNSHKITSFNREYISIASNQIPISRTYKTAVLEYLT